MIKYIDDEPLRDQIEIAGDPNTSPKLLADLASEYSVEAIRYLVFLNPNTPDYVAEDLGKHILLFKRPNKTLVYYFSHSFAVDRNLIYDGVSDLIDLYGGKFNGCNITPGWYFGYCDVDNTYQSTLSIYFSLDDVVFINDLDDPLDKGHQFDIIEWVAGEVGELLSDLGYEPDGWDCFG